MEKDYVCHFKVGDILKFIKNGGNNSSCFEKYRSIHEGMERLIVKKIHDTKHKHFGVLNGKVCTLETECGAFIWADPEYYVKTGSVASSKPTEVSDYPIF